MKKKTTYWIATVLVAFALLSGGVGQMMRLQPVATGLQSLGYPLYLLTILGMWKILGGLTLVWPGLPLLKEWAYAGIFFLLTGAAISHAVCGEWGHIASPVVLAILNVVSWALRPKDRVLAGVGGVGEDRAIAVGAAVKAV